jgi:hypothetical protein
MTPPSVSIFIPVLVGRQVSQVELDLLKLPNRFGGLGILYPSKAEQPVFMRVIFFRHFDGQWCHLGECVSRWMCPLIVLSMQHSKGSTGLQQRRSSGCVRAAVGPDGASAAHEGAGSGEH